MCPGVKWRKCRYSRPRSQGVPEPLADLPFGAEWERWTGPWPVEADGLDVVVGAFVLVLLRPGLRIIDV